jgi:hypothetical protein
MVGTTPTRDATIALETDGKTVDLLCSPHEKSLSPFSEICLCLLKKCHGTVAMLLDGFAEA